MTKHGWEMPPRYNEGDMFRDFYNGNIVFIERTYYWEDEWNYLLYSPKHPDKKDIWYKDSHMDLSWEKLA